MMASERSRSRRLGVLGSGNVGQAVGRHWVRAGHTVVFGARRPDVLRPLMDELGPAASAASLTDAAREAEVVLLAVPYAALDEMLPPLVADLAGKIVIDATNPVAASPEGRVISGLAPGTSAGVLMARRLPDSRVVRAFTHVMHELLISRGAVQPGLWAIAVAGDDADAKAVAEQLVRDVGFTPVDLGPLAGSERLDPGGPLFPQMFTAADMRARLAEVEAVS
jgi:predicted dinucleotide-binding enzyme